MEILRGRQKSSLKVVVYGPEGIGKSTFAACFPQPVFIDTEGSTKHMDVARTPKPLSWEQLLEQVQYFKHGSEFQTLVIDTADWAEQLAVKTVCSRAKKSGIEEFGYGKGYTYLSEEFGRLLNLLTDVVENGMHVVLNAHAKMRKFELPDEMGSYDRWEMKLGKNTAPLVKEWADLVLFANYKTHVVKIEDKYKAQGGTRVMYTAHHPCWDAKNRQGLPEELPFEFAQIAALFDASEAPRPEAPAQASDPLPPALRKLMQANGVTDEELRQAVASRGVYPADTPFAVYDPGYVEGVLIGAWPQVLEVIEQQRSKEGQLPF